MALKDIFTMVKADRYTADGCEELNKARKAEIEDAKEKPEGSISPDGKRIKQGGKWVPKKNASSNPKTGEGTSQKAAGSKATPAEWKETENQFGKKRLTMQTQHGPLKGQVHIYETDNPNQKHNRFKVDTGTHEDYFNTLEEAKAFAEKNHRGDAGAESKPAAEKPGKLSDEEEDTYRQIVTEFMRNKSAKTEKIMNEAKNHLIKNRGIDPAELARIGRDVFNKESKDAAPRVLTGDTKIKVRK